MQQHIVKRMNIECSADEIALDTLIFDRGVAALIDQIYAIAEKIVLQPWNFKWSAEIAMNKAIGARVVARRNTVVRRCSRTFKDIIKIAADAVGSVQ